VTGIEKLELPQFSIVDIRLVSREVMFTTGKAVVKNTKNASAFEYKCPLHPQNDSCPLYKHIWICVTTVSGGISRYVIVTVGNMIIFGLSRKTISFLLQQIVGSHLHVRTDLQKNKNDVN